MCSRWSRSSRRNAGRARRLWRFDSGASARAA
jgi:hypothetical protein